MPEHKYRDLPGRIREGFQEVLAEGERLVEVHWGSILKGTILIEGLDVRHGAVKVI